MKPRFVAALFLTVGFGMACTSQAPQAPAAEAAAATASAATPDAVNQHLTAAQEAAGTDFPGLLARVCIVPPTGRDAAAGRRRAGGVNGLTPAAAAPPTENVPPRSEWYQEPRQIFDDFYWVGNKRNNAWVIRTSAGLIVVDTLFHYSVEAEIVDGIRKLGMDPRDIKYVLISHGHGDHNGGAKILQDLGARIIMGGPDWDLMLNGTPLPGGNPKRDMVATDGQKLTLGDTTVTIYLTPGHTDGTLSFIFPVKDRGQTRVVAYPGGTAYNFPRSVERFEAYIETQKRFTKIAADAGASVILSNHSEFDSAYMKARMISTMLPGENNPFVITDGVQRYQTVLTECAEAEKARLMAGEDAPSR
jgi:metallo-beta-lactamase class B